MSFKPGTVYFSPTLDRSIKTILHNSATFTPALAERIEAWGRDGDFVILDGATFRKRQVYFHVWECVEVRNEASKEIVQSGS